MRAGMQVGTLAERDPAAVSSGRKPSFRAKGVPSDVSAYFAEVEAMSDDPEILDESAIGDDERTVIRRGAAEGMGGGVGELRDGIERLEPHLEDVSRVAHRLRRRGDSRRRRAAGGS